MVYRFQQGHSWFHRLDPLSKFFWLVCVSIVCLRFEDAAIQAAVFAAVAAAGRLLAGIRIRTILRGLQWPILFAAPYFILQLIFVPGETVLVRFGPAAVTAEALEFAAAITLRMLTLVLSSLVFIITTDPRDVVLAMAQQLRIPYRFAFAVSIALRFMPVLQAEAEKIRTVQRLRGRPQQDSRQTRRWRENLAHRKRFISAVFVGAIRRVQLTADVMELRGFGAHPDRTYLRRLEIRPAGIALAAASAALCLVMLIIF